jgi:hypothetical protein
VALSPQHSVASCYKKATAGAARIHDGRHDGMIGCGPPAPLSRARRAPRHGGASLAAG